MIYTQQTSGVTEKCLLCGNDVPLKRLSRHPEPCVQDHSSHDDDDFEHVPPFTFSQSMDRATGMQDPQMSTTLNFNAVASTCIRYCCYKYVFTYNSCHII